MICNESVIIIKHSYRPAVSNLILQRVSKIYFAFACIFETQGLSGLDKFWIEHLYDFNEEIIFNDFI